MLTRHLDILGDSELPPNFFFTSVVILNARKVFQQSKPNYRLLDSLVVEWWHRVREVPGSIPSHRLLNSLVVECWLRVREVPGSISSQGPPPQ